MKIFLTAQIVAVFLTAFAMYKDVSSWYNVYYKDGGWTTCYTVPVKIRKLRNILLLIAFGLSLGGFLFLIWS